ncbi:MAG: hypothetical protein JO031_09120 [Ktedonobacteraceae bacterium]|nr:hypothetical protein [Ktedonobacteraceae bacterium]
MPFKYVHGPSSGERWDSGHARACRTAPLHQWEPGKEGDQSNQCMGRSLHPLPAQFEKLRFS